jgi:hypothetical protein
MSFTSLQTGIENYAGGTKLLFPHPPIIEERFAESSISTVTAWSLSNTACVVQYNSTQARRYLKLFVRALSASEMATLTTLRDMGGLMYAKITPGTSTTILCCFGTDDEHEIEAMIADHPEKTAAGNDIPALLKVYDAHIVLVRME